MSFWKLAISRVQKWRWLAAFGKKSQPLEKLQCRVNDCCLIWEKLESSGTLPTPRDSHALCFADKHLYVLGGKNRLISEFCLSGVFRVSLETLVWEETTTSGHEPSAVGFTASSHKRRLFVFGGIRDGVATNEMFSFNLDFHIWDRLQPKGEVPEPRCDHGCAVVGDQLFVYGGCGGESLFYDDLRCFDIPTCTWTKPTVRGLLPFARSGHKFVAHRDKDIYLVGGYNDSSEKASVCMTGTYKYSLSSRKWKRPVAAGTGAPPCGLHGHAAFVVHSTLYVLGGLGPEGTEGLGTARVLKLINPSERKPVLEHLLGEFCTQSYSPSCWSPTTKPIVSYNIKADVRKTDAKMMDLINFTERHLPLSSASKGLHLQDVESSDLQLSLLRAYQAEFAAARQAFENERSELTRLLDKERDEVRSLIELHRKQNESWWNERLRENDRERQKQRLAWDSLETEKRVLATERDILEAKAKQVAELLKQITDV